MVPVEITRVRQAFSQIQRSVCPVKYALIADWTGEAPLEEYARLVLWFIGPFPFAL
jgi:hypothetical protein